MRFPQKKSLRFFSMLIVLAACVMTISGCDDDEEVKEPVITGFTPTSGFPGGTVTITGSNFSSAPANNQVSFNGAAATVTSSTTTQLVVTVPATASSGKITVTVNGKTPSSATDFTVLHTSISGFSPATGIVGSTVTITGTNFGATAAANTVKFNNTTAAVVSATATEVVATVPAGATTGKITVTVDGRTATSGTDFTVAQTTITGFSPGAGPVGTSVTIAGTNFSTTLSENIVEINGVETTVSAASATELTVSVPSEAATGKITVTIHGNTTTSANDFVVPPPVITSFFPPIAAEGISVTISGSNFALAPADNIIAFNGVEATVTAATATELTVTVPAGATTGPISLNVGPHETETSSDFETCSGSAELVISDVDVRNNAGATSYLVSFKVTNSGDVSANLTKMGMQNYASADDIFGGGDVAASGFSLSSGPTLAPGESYTTPNFSCNIVGGNTNSHSYLVITLYDSPDGEIPECDVNNNIVITPFD